MGTVGAVSKLDVLYEPDALFVGLLLFAPKTCPTCATDLPANTDYFSPSRKRADGLASECRRCCSRRSVARYLARRAAA